MWQYNSEQCFGFRALVNCLKKEKIFQIFSALDGTPHLSYFWLKLILIRQRWYWKLLYMNIPICVICAILSSFFGFLDLNGNGETFLMYVLLINVAIYPCPGWNFLTKKLLGKFLSHLHLIQGIQNTCLFNLTLMWIYCFLKVGS